MSRQSGQDGDDFSQMLDELAQAQKAQEAELSELTGGDDRPSTPSIDKERIADEVLSSIDSTAPNDPHQTFDDGEETKDEDGFAAIATTPESDNANAVTESDHDADAADEVVTTTDDEPSELDALAGLAGPGASEQDADPDDMLAALAAQTDDETADTIEPGAFEPAAFEPAADEESQAAAIAAMQASSDTSSRSPSRTATTSSRASSRTAASSRSGGQTKPARKPDASLKAIFAPVLVTFGLITLAPAIWAVMVLVGMDTWMSKAEGADTMAKVMLACWPVSLGLLAGGVISFMQVSKEKAKQRKREEAMAARQRG